MKRQYALYALATAPVVFGLVTTSYGVLLLASIVAITLLSMSVMAWVGVFSLSERIAHGAMRAWKAVVPTHASSVSLRQ